MEIGETLNVTVPSKGEIQVTILDILIDDSPYGDISYICYSPEHHLLLTCVKRTYVTREDPDDVYSEEIEVTTPPMFSHIISKNCTINN